MAHLFTSEKENAANGLKQAVRVASIADVNLAATLTILDGVNLNDGDRVLLKDQTTPSENGIYTWASGTQLLTRADDFQTGKVESAVLIPVQEGTSASKLWTLATASPIDVGTTALSFVMGGGAVPTLSSVLATGNTTGANDIEVTTGQSLTTETAGADLTVQPKTSAGVGGDLIVRGGDAGGTDQNGGDLLLRGGLETGAGTRGEIVSQYHHRFLTQATFPAAGVGETGALEVSLGGNLSGDLDMRRPNNGRIVTISWSDPIYVPLASFSQVNGLTADTLVGWISLDMNEWGRRLTWEFEAQMRIDNAARTGTLYIQDITNGQLISTLTLTGTTDITKVTTTLTTGGGAGELKYADTLYEIRLTMDGGSASNVTTLGNAYLKMTE